MIQRLRNVPRPEATAAILSVLISALLLGIKFGAYLLTGSTAILSDALESIVNVVASGFAAYSLFLAHQPADAEHPYGHGKVEFLSAGFEGGMILLAAIVILFEAIHQCIRGPAVEQVDAGLLLIIAAGIVNALTGFYLIFSGRRNRSVTLVADGHHLLSDAVTSGAVIAGLFVYRLTGWKYADPVTAIVVSLYIGWTAYGLLRTSAAGLMDQQDFADERLLRGILDAHCADREPRICSYHKLRHRHSGRYLWVDFHIMVPAHWDIDHGHRVASAIEYEIERAIGEGNATAHVEPCVDESCATCRSTPPANPANGE